MNLVAMTDSEYESWAPECRNRFAQAKIKSNGLTLPEAEKLAAEQFLGILPNGLNSNDNFLYLLKSDESEVLGYLWWALRGAKENKKAWLCDILIDEAHRGKGLGRKAMALLEDDVKEKGVSHIGLHVFAINEAAVNLYKSIGYQITNFSMEKTI